jgi:long-chain acyl-CoA synthetase
VHAAVVPSPGAHLDADELIAYAREHMAAYKYPRVVHVVETLPLGPSGKVLKRQLVGEYGAATPERRLQAGSR